MRQNYECLSHNIISFGQGLKLQSAKTVFDCFQEKKSKGNSGARTTYHHNHTLDHCPDIVVSDDDNMWYCFCYNLSQLMGLRYSPILKQRLIQASNSVQSYHKIN